MADLPHKHATQNDVAKKAGVDRSTVSLALRGSVNIPEKTRARVRAAAAELGYEPDPMLSALAYYRNSRRKKAYHGTLAWLMSAGSSKDWGGDWRAVTMYKETWLGARERAPAHGYNLEVFEMLAGGLTPQRVAGMFRSRNITGLLIGPQPRPNTEMDFPWGDFSSVTTSFTLLRPHLHTVAGAYYRDMMQTMQNIRSLGYRRVGLVYSKMVDARLTHYYLAGYLADCHLHGPEKPPPPLDPGDGDFGKWFRRARPDAIVAAGLAAEVIEAMLRRAGLRAPDDVGLARLPPDMPGGFFAGMCENSRQIGATAIDMLVSLVQQGIRGCPDHPRYTHIDGVWSPGASLPPRK
ncbi:MAG: LacI family DNA-binding transcriptional regulator [Opitutaceae bacterium]|jgi:LacI family transcriptional regulator/LacI family repressor for deo operon, udp, cdd, tsx, nupC, and nupG|nr:LacI family DNA-binding transcriptional regulator [Opitutaceae bacterium]